MFNGAHVIIYSHDADADRAFIRDVLGFPGVDAGQGWLIFKLPPAEAAVHPTEGAPQHEFYLMCEDLEATLARLAAQGVHRTTRCDTCQADGLTTTAYQPEHLRTADDVEEDLGWIRASLKRGRAA